MRIESPSQRLRQADRASLIAPLKVNKVGLHNIYFGGRHPRARTNDIRRLVSEPGSPMDFGMTDVGREAFEAAIPELIRTLASFGKKVVIVSSKLKRCKQAANRINSALQEFTDVPSEVITSPHLNERQWLALEGEPESKWDFVREADLENPQENKLGVESEIAFLGRGRRVVDHCEAAFKDCVVLFVSHCDTLQAIAELFGTGDFSHYSDYGVINYAQLVDFMKMP